MDPETGTIVPIETPLLNPSGVPRPEDLPVPADPLPAPANR